jgi:hypothetical protein
MLQHSAAVLPFPGHHLPPPALRRRHSPPPSRPQPTQRLDLRSFTRLLHAEGLSDQLPDLETQVDALSDEHRSIFGFSFDPEEIRIAERDLPWMLLGLRKGILTRPLVIDSPCALDAVRLGLALSCSMLRYRFECLERSGIHFRNSSGSWALWSDLRWPRIAPLADAVRRLVGPRLPSSSDLAAVYERLPLSVTIGDRLGAAPRFLLVGRDREPVRNRVLAARPDGRPAMRSFIGFRYPALALERGCRFLSPEAALLLLGSQELRSGESSLLAADGPIWLSGLDPFGRVAMMQSEVDGIVIMCGDPRRNEPFDRLPASSE